MGQVSAMILYDMLSGIKYGDTPSSTRGLDASTALEWVRALRIATDVARFSSIVSIYQAGQRSPFNASII